jgi:hypothetical protein
MQIRRPSAIKELPAEIYTELEYTGETPTFQQFTSWRQGYVVKVMPNGSEELSIWWSHRQQRSSVRNIDY